MENKNISQNENCLTSEYQWGSQSWYSLNTSHVEMAISHVRRAVFSLLALATAPLVFAAPAHADSISIDLDTTAVTLQRSGNLYKHNSSVRVRNSNTYGFTLSMNANQPNMVNDKDSTYKIDSVSGTNQQLAANQWGYGMGKNATTFSSVSSATLADIASGSKGSCSAVDDCTLYLTLGANINPKKLPTGNYSTNLTYTATSKPAPYVPPAPDPEPYVPPTPPAPDPEPSTPSSSGGSSSHSSLYDLCESRYPGSSDIDKWSYCFNHNGDMSGYVKPVEPSYPSYPTPGSGSDSDSDSDSDSGSGSGSGSDYSGGSNSGIIQITDPLGQNFQP